MVWNTPLQAGALSPADKQGYGFIYDGINRLLTSNYGEGTNFATNANANNENVTYDKNGNIKTLTRYKKGIGLIDNLSYTYKNGNASNMLDKVDDVVAGAEGFSELVKQANEYAFDANGNLIKDDNKGYNSILYNYLNLPKRVGTTGQYISYIYDAAGTKLAKVGTGGALTYYAGDFVYSGSSLNYIITGEGMYLPGGSYHYYLKDHLGNTRLVVNTSGTGGTVVQQADYYPFGMDIKTYSSGAENKYRYNGKELQDDAINGKRLDWYDYGARFYDPELGRFTTIDPMAEKYYPINPYAYVANNPIKYIDPDGMRIDDYRLDIYGNIELLRKTEDKTDKLITLDDKGVETEKTIEVDKSILGNVQSSKDSQGTGYDYLQVENNETATNLFEFVSENSRVEWSHVKYGTISNYISTSHDPASEAGGVDLMYNLLIQDYTVREHIHSHPNRRTNYHGPSGFHPNDRNSGDRLLGEWLNTYYPKKGIKLKVYEVPFKKYIKYNHKGIIK